MKMGGNYQSKTEPKFPRGHKVIIKQHQQLQIATRPQTRLCEEDASDLSEALAGHAHQWRDIGIALGFTPSEMGVIAAKPALFSSAPVSWLTDMLSTWVQWNPETHGKYATLQDLTAALQSRAVGLGVVAEELQRKVEDFGTSQEDDLSEPPSKVRRVKKASPYEIIRLKLSSCYTKKPEVPEGTWPPVTTSQFVALALVNSKQISSEFARETVRGSIDDIKKEKEEIEYYVVFEGLEDGARVLFEGRPGCGKTTLMHKTSQEWGNGNLLKDRLFFLIHLRRFTNRPDISLEDLIKASAVDLTQSEIEYLCSDITRSSGKGVVFAINGLDEYDPKEKEKNFIFNLIKRNALPNSIVIVASRPAATQKFRRIIDKRVEVLGFLKAQIEEYVGIYFCGREEKAEELMKYLREHPNVFHICYIPLHVAMVSYLFDCVGSDLPTTETEIYRLFMLYTLLRSICKARNIEVSDCPFQLESFDDLEGENKQLFTAICKLAFESIISSKQVFSNKDVKDFFKKEAGNSGSDESTLGLVVVDRCFIKYGLSEIYSFLHLTIQEYLAAVHIASLADSEQRKVFEKHGRLKRLEEVWKFHCGMVVFDTPERLDNFKVLVEKTKSRQLLHFRCAFESQQAVLCHHLLSSSDFSIKLEEQSLNPADCTALGYVLCTSEQSNKPCKSLYLFNCRIRPEGYDALVKEIGECSLSMEKFRFFRQLRSEEGKYFADLLLKLPSLHVLDLGGVRIYKECWKFVVPAIPLSVIEVDFNSAKIGAAGVETLASVLPQCKNLEKLK